MGIRVEHLLDQHRLPFGQRDKGVGPAVSPPCELGGERPRQEGLRGAHDRLLDKACAGRSRTQAGVQLGDDDLHAFGVREIDIAFGRAAKKVDQVPVLALVPPAHVLDFHAIPLQRRLGLLDLDLKPAMRQRKGQRMVKEDFHFSILAFWSETLKA
jgi:hypothetical protein